MTLQNATPEYLEQCRQALTAEQTKSLAETENWSHVDKAQIHIDWDVLYKELAPLIAGSLPSSSEVQFLIARHYSIVSRFYSPSRQAYIGMTLFYQDNPDMRAFHIAYHPQMVDFLSEAVFVYANDNL